MAGFAKVTIFAAACALLGMAAGSAQAASCGKDGKGFAAWVEDYRASREAQGLDTSPLANVKYDTGVIKIDRNQKGAFKGTLAQFMARRAPASYVSKAKGLMKSQAGLLSKIQKKYGVQPEVIGIPAKIAPCTITGFVTPKMNAFGAIFFHLMS